jgi:membrane-bound lytic murein transglycosylase D
VADAGDSSQRIRYRIKPGDTLAAIATEYGTTVQSLQQWNGLRGTRIPAGGLLTIYTTRKF